MFRPLACLSYATVKNPI